MDRYEMQAADRATDARRSHAAATNRLAQAQGREADAQMRQAAAMERIADALERLLTTTPAVDAATTMEDAT